MVTNTEMKVREAKASPQKGTAEEYNHIKKVIAVMSGKGGVGKSFVTGLLASGLAKRGLKVGVLDADITGPSIPTLFGLHGNVDVGEFGILPFESRTGIKVISMNLLLESEDKPIIWRGPLVSRSIQQLWGDVMWGDLDMLLIDLPPGTSDAALTIMGSLPVDGLVMTTTPQSLASMVVTKAINMAKITNVEIIGIVENMAYFDCPDCHRRYFIFGESHSPALAEKANAPILAQIPIDPKISSYCDAGNMEDIQFEGLDDFMKRFLRATDSKEAVRYFSESFDLKLKPDNDAKSDSFDDYNDAEEEPELEKYSPIAQKIILSQENVGYFANPDLSGEFRGCCGDSIHMELLLDGDLIQDACFTTDGCSATIAVAGMLTRMIKGKTLDQAQKIEPNDIITALNGLPKGHLHCADLAVKALHHTIDSPMVG
jgi:Mrp family chromosome partitioning ATPase/NifU-like protein involved in Fe-S cluster formation